jgi:hypothetical protein
MGPRTKLGREVAIKVMPAALAADAERLSAVAPSPAAESGDQTNSSTLTSGARQGRWNDLRETRAAAVRLQWPISAEKGDYRTLLGREATPGQVRAEMANGWTFWATRYLEYLLPVRVEAAGTAVDLYRQIDDHTHRTQGPWPFTRT